MSYMTNFTAIGTLCFNHLPHSSLCLILDYQKKDMSFFMVMLFATDEINKNPYILPNISLLFFNIIDMCQDTLSFLEIVHLPENYSIALINYVCGEGPRCEVNLTGPSWKTSLKWALQSRTPKVRIYDTE